MSKQTNALLTILSLCVLSSFLSGCGFFEETICCEAEGQNRNGIIYLPNQKEPFTGKSLCRYPNGQKMEEGRYKYGKKEGKWNHWWWNGQKMKEENYKDGKKEGKWIQWWENGQKMDERNYKDGKEEGKRTKWDRNGQIRKAEED